MENTTPYLFLWGFSNEGTLFLDAGFLIIKQNKKEIEQAHTLSLRHRYNPNLNMSLLHIPEGQERDFIQSFIDYYNRGIDKEVLAKLNDSKVSMRHILREKEATNTLDWIVHKAF